MTWFPIVFLCFTAPNNPAADFGCFARPMPRFQLTSERNCLSLRDDVRAVYNHRIKDTTGGTIVLFSLQCMPVPEKA